MAFDQRYCCFCCCGLGLDNCFIYRFGAMSKTTDINTIDCNFNRTQFYMGLKNKIISSQRNFQQFGKFVSAIRNNTHRQCNHIRRHGYLFLHDGIKKFDLQFT